MSFQCFFRKLYDIAVAIGVTGACAPKNFADAKCLAEKTLLASLNAVHFSPDLADDASNANVSLDGTPDVVTASKNGIIVVISLSEDDFTITGTVDGASIGTVTMSTTGSMWFSIIREGESVTLTKVGTAPKYSYVVF